MRPSPGRPKAAELILNRAKVSCEARKRLAKLWPVGINPKSADKPGSVTADGCPSAMTVILLGASLPVRSSHLPADLREQRQCPPTWCCSGWRLPRFTRLLATGGDSSLWPCSSPSSAALTATYSVWALPSILPGGVRTFLPDWYQGGHPVYLTH